MSTIPYVNYSPVWGIPQNSKDILDDLKSQYPDCKICLRLRNNEFATVVMRKMDGSQAFMAYLTFDGQTKKQFQIIHAKSVQTKETNAETNVETNAESWDKDIYKDPLTPPAPIDPIDPIDPIGKKWYESKTVWFNLVSAIVVIIQQYVTGFVLTAQTEMLILMVINLVLRVVTKDPIVWTLGKTNQPPTGSGPIV